MPDTLVTRSLSTELVLRMAMPLGGFALLLMLFMGMAAEQRERELIGSSLNGIALRVARGIDYQLGERLQDIGQLAVLEATPAYFDAEASRRLFDNKVMRQPAFAWIGFADAQGRLLAASGGRFVGESIAGQPEFEQARSGLHVGAFQTDPRFVTTDAGHPPLPGSDRFMSLSMAVVNDNGLLEGVMTSKLGWTWLQEMLAAMQAEYASHEGLELYLLDRNDEVIAGTHAYPPANELQPPAGKTPDESRTWQERTSPDGSSCLLTWSSGTPGSIPVRLGWRVIVRQPAETALGPVRTLRLQLGAAAALLTLGVMLLAWIQARRISRPLARIADTAGEVATGKTRSIQTGSHLNEVERLASALQQMVDSLLHSELQRSELHQLAHRDTLTGLHNRRALELQMETAAARTARSGEQFVVFALDLDGFKPVNDSLGHAAGDDLLREVARRLLKAVRREEMLARLGGDEFVILMMSSPEQLLSHATLVAERIQACFTEGFRIEGQTVRVGCSIGVAAGQAGEAPEQLLPRADEALYAAKRAGRGRVAWWQPAGQEVTGKPA